MIKEHDFRTAALAFTDKVKNIKYYDEPRWFRSLYSTLSAFRTIKGGSLSGADKTFLQRLLFSALHDLKSIAVNEYDTWFYGLAQRITSNVAKLSFGHAQKLINILMKYHFVYYYSGLDETWKTRYTWLEPFFEYLHAPIDRIVLTNLRNRYSVNIPPNKLSWTKWNWYDKALYEAIQQWIQQRVDEDQTYYGNRLYFEMKELWINPSTKEPTQKRDYQKVKTMASESLKSFLSEIVDEINQQGFGLFEVNETYGYFSIQRGEVKKYKNIACFVKKEPVLSISKYANIYASLFDNPPFNTLKRRRTPPQGLQLRKESWDLYPHHVEYDLSKDKDVILQFCLRACQNYRRS